MGYPGAPIIEPLCKAFLQRCLAAERTGAISLSHA